jgi:hypothetical protein
MALLLVCGDDLSGRGLVVMALWVQRVTFDALIVGALTFVREM